MELLGRYSKLPKLPKIDLSGRRPQRTLAPPRIHRAERRLNAHIIAQLVTDYEAGQSTPALMATYGLGKSTVLRLLRHAGVEMRGQGQKNIDLAGAMKMYEAGWSLAKLAARYDCDHETVRTALKAAGVTLRPRNGWPPAGASPAQ